MANVINPIIKLQKNTFKSLVHSDMGSRGGGEFLKNIIIGQCKTR